MVFFSGADGKRLNRFGVDAPFGDRKKSFE
jgi:hypothetical protein